MSKRNDRDSGKDADVELLIGNEPLATGKGPTFDSLVSIRIDHYRCRLADPRGISEKAAIDGLVNCGILRDDSTKEIAEIRDFQHKVKNADEERTEITITEIREMSDG